MEYRNKGLIALVTGGSRGIGRAIALRLAETEADTIVVNYLENEKEAQNTKTLIDEKKANCILEQANLLFPEEIDRLFANIEAKVSHIDAFIHCSAINSFKPLSNTRPNQWDLIMNINARAFLQCAIKSASLMKTGKIVGISSLGSHRVVPNYGAMGPTKAALEAIIRYLAVELAPRGIQINGVSGGLIETDSLKQFPDSTGISNEVVSRIPVKRLGTPEEIANIVMFLIGPGASYIQGQIIVADGGMSLI